MAETTPSTTVYEAAQALADNLAATVAFRPFYQARQALDTDREARALLQRLSDLQATLRQKQMRNEITQADINALRALQNQARDNATIEAYARTQEAAVALLRSVNQEISQMLGVDFATLARQTSC